MSIQCDIAFPKTGELLFCPLIIYKYGSPTFSYTAICDYGDGYNQTIVFTQNNYSGLVYEYQSF